VPIAVNKRPIPNAQKDTAMIKVFITQGSISKSSTI
jgi:hypothetical protein